MSAEYIDLSVYSRPSAPATPPTIRGFAAVFFYLAPEHHAALIHPGFSFSRPALTPSLYLVCEFFLYAQIHFAYNTVYNVYFLVWIRKDRLDVCTGKGVIYKR